MGTEIWFRTDGMDGQTADAKTIFLRLRQGITKVLMTAGSLMKVESIAECSLGAFCNTFDLH